MGLRTHDLFLTKEVLYQLSYNSVTASSYPPDTDPTSPVYWKPARPGRAGDGI